MTYRGHRPHPHELTGPGGDPDARGRAPDAEEGTGLVLPALISYLSRPARDSAISTKYVA